VDLSLLDGAPGLAINAVMKLGPGRRFEFNYDYFEGCGICDGILRAARSRWCPKPFADRLEVPANVRVAATVQSSCHGR
jgi:hypothetical protein